MKFEIHDFHLQSVNNRLELLLLVLQYDTQFEPHFSIHERILINQQRADLMMFKRYLFKEADLTDVRFFLLPEKIDQEIEQIKNNINQMAWKPQVYKDD